LALRNAVYAAMVDRMDSRSSQSNKAIEPKLVELKYPHCFVSDKWRVVPKSVEGRKLDISGIVSLCERVRTQAYREPWGQASKIRRTNIIKN